MERYSTVEQELQKWQRKAIDMGDMAAAANERVINAEADNARLANDLARTRDELAASISLRVQAERDRDAAVSDRDAAEIVQRVQISELRGILAEERADLAYTITELAHLRQELLALCPGGSEFMTRENGEFVPDANSCLDWLRQRMRGPFVELKNQNERLRHILVGAPGLLERAAQYESTCPVISTSCDTCPYNTYCPDDEDNLADLAAALRGEGVE